MALMTPTLLLLLLAMMTPTWTCAGAWEVVCAASHHPSQPSHTCINPVAELWVGTCHRELASGDLGLLATQARDVLADRTVSGYDGIINILQVLGLLGGAGGCLFCC